MAVAAMEASGDLRWVRNTPSQWGPLPSPRGPFPRRRCPTTRSGGAWGWQQRVPRGRRRRRASAVVTLRGRAGPTCWPTSLPFTQFLPGTHAPSPPAAAAEVASSRPKVAASSSSSSSATSHSPSRSISSAGAFRLSPASCALVCCGSSNGGCRPTEGRRLRVVRACRPRRRRCCA